MPGFWNHMNSIEKHQVLWGNREKLRCYRQLINSLDRRFGAIIFTHQKTNKHDDTIRCSKTSIEGCWYRWDYHIRPPSFAQSILKTNFSWCLFVFGNYMSGICVAETNTRNLRRVVWMGSVGYFTTSIKFHESAVGYLNVETKCRRLPSIPNTMSLFAQN
jgi:hypothetical protein